MFPITPDIAADTGIHLGDGNLLIGRGSYLGTYRYELTGHAVEDQLYLLGYAVPLIKSAYGIGNPRFYVNPQKTWMSVRYHNKTLVLFKHQQLGLPNGKKTHALIPSRILSDTKLMRHFAREILATDGVLGFYNASPSKSHKYPRIQIKMTARNVIKELAKFLRAEMGITVSCRLDMDRPDSPYAQPQHLLQINRSEDVEKWRTKIGFSNPSHISRFMVFEQIGECPPRTSIVNRLMFLTGCSARLNEFEAIPLDAMARILNLMRKCFGSPMSDGKAITTQIKEINLKPTGTLHRTLPWIIVD
jgi:hypothetical protein